MAVSPPWEQQILGKPQEGSFCFLYRNGFLNEIQQSTPGTLEPSPTFKNPEDVTGTTV